jgi:chemotaxis protein methyltransferase CheR
MTLDRDVEDLEVRLFLEAIAARYGYDLRGYEPASMRRRVRAALVKSGAANLGDLQHRLLIDPRVFAAVVGDLTVQVSEMFRDPPFYRDFREEVVPILRTYPQLKIWHAGCASGEEVYTTAILLSEEGLLERAQLYATDLSLRALERAKAGIYPAARARAFAESYALAGGAGAFESYFQEGYDNVVVREALRRNVVFFQHDLVADHVFGEMQVIFCRNVLIYFGADLRERVLAKLGQGLCRGGFLCLGASERLSPASRGRTFAELQGKHPIYRRGMQPPGPAAAAR